MSIDLRDIEPFVAALGDYRRSKEEQARAGGDPRFGPVSDLRPLLRAPAAARALVKAFERLGPTVGKDAVIEVFDDGNYQGLLQCLYNVRQIQKHMIENGREGAESSPAREAAHAAYATWWRSHTGDAFGMANALEQALVCVLAEMLDDKMKEKRPEKGGA